MADRWPLTAIPLLRAGDDAYRVERVLSTARLVVAAAFAFFLHFGPFAPAASSPAVDACGAGYLLYATVLFVALRSPRKVPGLHVFVVHLGDMAWASVCTVVDGGPSSAFFALHIFAVLAAAYRWGLPETLGTALVATVLVAFEAQLLRIVHSGALTLPAEDPQSYFRRVAYLMITAYLGGYLANEDRRLRQQTAIHARLVASAKSEHGFFSSLQAVAVEVLRTFMAREFVLAIDDRDAGRLYAISTTAAQAAAPGAALKAVELPAVQRDAYFFEAPAAWSAVQRRGSRRATSADDWVLVALDAHGSRTDSSMTLPQAFLALRPCQTAMGITLPFGEGSSARLLLLDQPRRMLREPPLRFVQQLVRELGPIVHGIYLYRHLRRRAGAIERARMARELHDGVIQSLIGVEMRLEALRMRRSAADDDVVGAELAQLQHSVREEVLNLRDLMQQMKPRDVSPKQLTEYLIDIVDRFRRDTGIQATFTSDLEEVALPQPARRELARIVQEALINVRKHSGARHVLVALERRNGAYHLVVDDDGKGYDFEGRLGQAELDAARRGPVVIKERVRAIGGEIVIDSAAGRGSRLEVIVPHRSAHPAG